MQKEKLLKTVLLLGALLVIVIVHFNYDGQINDTNTHNYGKETVCYNPTEYYINETPAKWLLNLSNTTLNKSFEKSHNE